MIILGVNNNNDLIYVYTEDKSKIDYLLSAIKNNKSCGKLKLRSAD